MADTQPPVPFDALLRHRDWVRALALRLVADPNTADDVEQETWLEAIRRPPRGGSSPRGWLGTVTRNAARKFGRSTSRRERHESTAAWARPQISPDDLAAEAEIGKRLVELVLALDEPYRGTVLMRWFEGLETAEISRRQGVPVETVRTRLKRATAQLRERMDERHGGRRAWAVLLVGPSWKSTGLVAAGKGIAMGTAKKVAIAAALLLVMGGTAWEMWPRQDRNVAEAVATNPSTDAPVREPRRTKPAVPPPATADAPVDPLLRVDPKTARRVTVRTADGKPVAGAVIELFLRRELNPQVSPETRSRFGETPSPDGRFTTGADGVALLPRLPHPVSGTMLVRRKGFAPATASAGVDEIVLLPGCELAGRVVDAKGRAVARARVVAGALGANAWIGPDPSTTPTVADDDGRFALHDLARGTTSLFACRPGGTPCKTLETVLPGVREVTIVLAGGGTIGGKVTELLTGAPVEGATVAASWSGDGWTVGPAFGAATTRADGTYRIDGFPADQWDTVTVSKPGWYEPAHGSHSIHNGLPLDAVATIDLQLARGGHVTGRILGPGGPVADASIAAIGAGDGEREARRRATSGADGAYVIDGLPPGRAALAVQAKGCVQEGWSGRWIDDFRAGSAPAAALVEVRAGEETTKDLVLVRGVEIAGSVLETDGSAAPGARVSLRYSDNSEEDGPLGWNAAPSKVTDAQGRFVLTGVAPATKVQVDASADDAGASASLALARADVRDVVLRLVPRAKPATAHVRVIWPDGATPADAVWLVGDGGSLAKISGNRDYAFLRASPHVVPNGGTFDVPLIAMSDGPMLVRVLATGFVPADSPPLTIAADAHDADVEIRPVPAVAARVKGVVVVKGADEPVAFAQVRVRLVDPSAPPRRDEWYQGMPRPVVGPVVASTDARGEFDAQGLAPGRYDVQVIAAGFEWWTGKADVPSDGLRVELPRLGALTGRVHFADGSPAAGVRVGAGRQDAWRAETIADADGRFRFDDAPTGGLSVWVCYAFDGTGADVRQQGVQGVSGWKHAGDDLDVTVEPGLSIAGKLVDGAGAPFLATAIVRASREGGARGSESIGTRPDGKFAVRGLAQGRYRVSVDIYQLPGRPPARCDAVENVEAGVSGLVLVAHSGLSIEGVAEIPSDAARSALRVLARRPEFRGRDVTRTPDRPGTMDSAGRFRIDGLESGRWRIVFEDDQGLESPWQAGDAAIAQAGDASVQLVLSTTSTISGRVTFEGQGMQNCTVYVHAVGDEKDGCSMPAWFEGKFTFVGLDPSKRWDVSTWRDGLAIAHADSVSVGTAGLELVLTRGLDLKGRLLRSDGSPSGRTQLRLESADGRLDAWASCDDHGEIVAHAVPAGEHVVKAWIAGAKQGESGAYVEIGRVRAGDVNVELRMPR